MKVNGQYNYNFGRKKKSDQGRKKMINTINTVDILDYIILCCSLEAGGTVLHIGGYLAAFPDLYLPDAIATLLLYQKCLQALPNIL